MAALLFLGEHIRPIVELRRMVANKRDMILSMVLDLIA